MHCFLDISCCCILINHTYDSHANRELCSGLPFTKPPLSDAIKRVFHSEQGIRTSRLDALEQLVSLCRCSLQRYLCLTACLSRVQHPRPSLFLVFLPSFSSLKTVAREYAGCVHSVDHTAFRFVQCPDVWLYPCPSHRSGSFWMRQTLSQIKISLLDAMSS